MLYQTNNNMNQNYNQTVQQHAVQSQYTQPHQGGQMMPLQLMQHQVSRYTQPQPGGQMMPFQLMQHQVSRYTQPQPGVQMMHQVQQGQQVPQQSYSHQQQAQVQQHVRQHATQQVQHQPRPSSQQHPAQKQRYNLTPEAEAALQEAVFSAIRNNGQIDSLLLERAIAQGLPKKDILNAALAAVDRDKLGQKRIHDKSVIEDALLSAEYKYSLADGEDDDDDGLYAGNVITMTLTNMDPKLRQRAVDLGLEAALNEEVKRREVAARDAVNAAIKCALNNENGEISSDCLQRVKGANIKEPWIKEVAQTAFGRQQDYIEKAFASAVKHNGHIHPSFRLEHVLERLGLSLERLWSAVKKKLKQKRIQEKKVIRDALLSAEYKYSLADGEDDDDDGLYAGNVITMTLTNMDPKLRQRAVDLGLEAALNEEVKRREVAARDAVNAAIKCALNNENGEISSDCLQRVKDANISERWIKQKIVQNPLSASYRMLQKSSRWLN